MWKIKEFKTKETMQNFIEYYSKHSNFRYQEIFINNGYCLEYRFLQTI
jgi:hypothetical protein